MKNCFILATNDRSLSFLWPGKIDTVNTNVFTNTSLTTLKKIGKNDQFYFNNTTQLVLYICLCFGLTFLVVKRFLLKKR